MNLTAEEFLQDLTNRIFFHHYDFFGYGDVDAPELPVEDCLCLYDNVVEIRIDRNRFEVSAPVIFNDDIDDRTGCEVTSNLTFVGVKDPVIVKGFNAYTKALIHEIINVIALVRGDDLDEIKHNTMYHLAEQRLDNFVRPKLNDGLPVMVRIEPHHGVEVTALNLTYKYTLQKDA